MGTAGVSEITTQLGLYAWQDGSDYYNHTQLAANWDTIDSKLLKKSWSNSGDTAQQIRLGTATGTSIILGSVTSDSYERIEINSGGTVKWGSGGTSTDTNLYRAGSSILATDSVFRVASGTIQFLSGTASLIGSADKVSTNNILSITRASSSGTSILIGTGTYSSFKIKAGGNLSWGDGTSESHDTSLYRSGAGTLVVESSGGTVLSVSSNSLGFFGSVTAQSSGWSSGPSSVNSGVKTYNAGSVSLSEIANALGNVIIALRQYGILGA
jgi:hypothetical protein